VVPQRPIVVCHPVWKLSPGGLERQLLQVVKGLPADRFAQVLVVRGWEGNTCLDRSSLGPHVRLVADQGTGKDRRWALRLAAILREHRVDILHVRGFSMLLDAVAAAVLAGRVAVAFSFHGLEAAESRFGWMRKRLYRAATRRCADCWAVSRTAAEAVAEKLGLPAGRFGVLPNGIDARKYQPTADIGAVRRRLGLPEDRLIVLSVGNLKPVKGHDVLLEAFRRLGEDAERATLLLVGGDYLGGELQRWVDRHLASRDVRFLGEQAEPLAWYQSADIFVLPSRWEGASNALLEAMACGLPTVATNVGGNREVLRHEYSGLLVPADDPDSLASAMRRLIHDEASRRAFGEAGRRSIVEDYSIERTLERYAGRYEALVGRRECGAGIARTERVTPADGEFRALERVS